MGKRAWTAAGAIFLGQVFCSTLFRDPFCIPKLIPLALGILVLWLGHVHQARQASPHLDYAVKGMALALTLSTWLSIDKTVSLIGPHQAGFYGCFQFALCALLFYGITYSSVKTGEVEAAIVLAAIPVGVLAILQHYGLDDWLSFSIQNGRAGSTFGSPIYLGAFMALVTPLAWGWANGDGWRRPVGVLSITLAVVSIIFARSRGGAFAALVGVLVQIALSHRRFSARAALACFYLCLGVAVVAFTNPSSSDVGRVEVWRAALYIWKHYPIFGSGPDTFGLAFRGVISNAYISAVHNTREIQLSAHNDVLQVLATLGIFGFCAYAVLLLAVLRVTVKFGSAAACGAVAAVLAQAKLNPVPLAVIAAIVALVATLGREDVSPMGRRALFGGSALASVCVLVTFCMCRAEFYQARGERKNHAGAVVAASFDFIRAAQSNPFDFAYTQKEIEHINYMIPYIDPKAVPAVVAFALSIANFGVMVHPRDAEAHGWRSISLAMAGQYVEADIEATKELLLAPTFLPAYQRKLQFALGRNDGERARQYQEKVNQLILLEQGTI